MRRTPVFTFGWRASVVLTVWSVGFVVDLLDDAKRLVEVGHGYLVSLDQVEPGHSDLDELVLVDIQIETIDVIPFPGRQEADSFDRISFHANARFEHLEDLFFDCFCHVHLGIFRNSSSVQY